MSAAYFFAMEIAATFSTRSYFIQSPSTSHHHRKHSFAVTTCRVSNTRSCTLFTPSISFTVSTSTRNKFHPAIVLSSGNGGSFSGGSGSHGSGIGGGEGGGHGDRDDQDRSRNDPKQFWLSLR